MKAQEILEGVCRHRATPMPDTLVYAEIVRKVTEIEWALQAISEKLVELEARSGT